MSGFDLRRQIDLLLTNWDTGIRALNVGWGYSCQRPSIDELVQVMPDVLEEILDHQSKYNIVMHNYDCNKITNYVAWHVKQRFGEKYATCALFYGHLHFIDESIRSSSLFNIPNLPLIAENMEIFHRNGHKMAPYTFIKGVDLTFTFCCGDGGPK